MDMLYEAAIDRLQRLWDGEANPGGSLPDGLAAAIETVLDGRERSPRWALLTQLLLKAEQPDIDCRYLNRQHGLPSARTFAQNTTVPFDQSHGAPLGGADDPYVSNPLRRERIDASLLQGAATDAQWAALIRILDAAETDQAIADAALPAVVASLRSRVLTLRDLLIRGIELQPTDDQQARHQFVSESAPNIIKPLVAEHELDVEGSAGKGSPAEIPWVRIFRHESSPSAQQGWYVAYLFAADGSHVHLALMQGVTEGTGVEAAAAEVRQRLGVPEGFVDSIDLKSAQTSSSARPRLYERATAVAASYTADSMPSTEMLEEHLGTMASMLVQLYEYESSPPDVSEITLSHVLEQLQGEHLEFPEALVKSILAAVHAGQHVLLTGPPGTGKTSLAVALAAAAAARGATDGFAVATATADWTSADTIGAYWPTPDTGTLEFQPGLVMSAIENDRWLIIDELNRADIDKSFGALFTLLSGRPVRLPQQEEHEGELWPVEVVPPYYEDPEEAGPATRVVTPNWRLIATLNTRDRDLLFNLSYALLRRFAVIDVPVLPPDALEEILAAQGLTGVEAIDTPLRRLVKLPHRVMGPAILLDTSRYLKARVKLEGDDGVDADAVLGEALSAFFAPQLDDVPKQQQTTIVDYIKAHVLRGIDENSIRRLLGFPPAASVAMEGSEGEDVGALP